MADTAFLQLVLDNGITVQSFFSHSAIREDIFYFYGKTGKLKVDRYHSFNLEFIKSNIKPSRFPPIVRHLKQLINSPVLLSKLMYPNKEPSYKPALDYFANAIETQTLTTPNLWDGYYSFLVAKAAEQSAKSGMVVNMQEFMNRNNVIQSYQ